MDIVRQDSSVRIQRYDFHESPKEKWNMAYREFNYPTKQDQPADEGNSIIVSCLEIARKRDYEGIYLRENGEIFCFSDGDIYDSPVFDELKNLSKIELDRIRQGLSEEARKLLDRGLERCIRSS